MNGRIVALGLLLLSAGFVGCIGGKDNGPKVDKQATNQTGVIAANETSQPNGGQISAFKETNRTETAGQGAMMHMHDYWGKETRKVIWTATPNLIPLPLLPDGKPAGTAIADFDIPYPSLVYEGTDHLEVLVKDVKVTEIDGGSIDQAQPAHPHATIYFDYLTAADEPGKFRQGGQLVDGTPFILPVKPTDADMPHSEKSLWVFRIYTGEANSVYFNITVTAVKGNAIALWPPHPDLYAEKPDRVVFDGDVKLHNEGTAQVNVDGKDVAWTYPERIISYGTDTVDVTISNVQFSAQGLEATPVGAPDHFVLEYHNATFVPKLGNGDQAGARVEDKGTDGKTWHFTIKVDAQSYDSVYGQKSRWGFRFLPRFANDPTNCFAGLPLDDATYHDIQNFVVGCQYFPWDMSYHVKIVAHGHSTAMGIDAMDPNAASPTPPTKA